MDVRVSSPVFIGRSDELGRLHAALDAARNGESHKVLVSGEAGVGKTRLLTEFADAARSSGAVVLLGGCIDLGDRGVPYAPIVEALRTWARDTPEEVIDAVLAQGRSDLARLVPGLAPAAADRAGEPGSGLNIGSAQGRLFEVVLAALERLAATEPVVLLVEDLHWSDRSTRDLLGFLVRNVRNVGVVLVLTYRSDELHRRHPLLPFLAELERSGRVERLDLARFDRLELGAQLGAIAGKDLDPALVDSIHARSSGNPFFAEELLISARDMGSADLPPTLREVLLAHVAGLSDDAQELLRVAAAAGQRVDPALLANVTKTDTAGLYGALREAVNHQILLPDVVAGEERYAFRHALLQEAVYGDLLPGERTRLHAAFAQALDAARIQGDTSRLSELAYHWYAAHDLPRAFDASLIAAAGDEGRYAFAEALGHYERAIELWDLVPDAASRAGHDRIELLTAAASVGRFNEPARAVAHVRTALGLLDEEADPIRAGLLRERLGRYAWIAGEGAESLADYRKAVQLIPADPPSEARAQALAGLAQILMLQRSYRESRPLADEAIELARATGARQIEGHALNTRSQDRVQDGEVDEALEDLDAARLIAEEVGNVDDLGRAYGNRVDVLYVANRLEEAIEVAAMGIEVGRRLGLHWFFGSHLLCNTSNFLYLLGRWDESDRAVRAADEVGPQGLNYILVQELQARLAVGRGQFAEAADRLRVIRPMAVHSADGQVVLPVHASAAELALWQRRPVDAEEAVAAGLAALNDDADIRCTELYALGLRAHADRAELARARRSADELAVAIAAGRQTHEVIRQRHVATAHLPALAPQSAAWLTAADAELTRLEGATDPDAWAASARAWDGLGRPYAVAYARWRQAEALLATRGDRKLAASVLRDVADTAKALGALPLEREVDALALRARISLAPDEPVAPGPVLDDAARLGLTTREREVLALVAAGRTNRQIGEELFISEKTAGVHVSNILGKLSVAGRGEAAALAHQLGLTGTGDRSG